jgi:hypothetical protein
VSNPNANRPNPSKKMKKNSKAAILAALQIQAERNFNKRSSGTTAIEKTSKQGRILL